ncbi:MAG: DUF2892 domain-containing protein [Alphaproteobacteria bacterium]|nr:DUF2892 domain-containing protein [Alphaproteobacteria bacterium]
MACNVGNTDRILRILVGLAIIVAGLVFENWLGAVGVILVITGLIRWCPAYLPFGIRTNH